MGDHADIVECDYDENGGVAKVSQVKRLLCSVPEIIFKFYIWPPKDSKMLAGCVQTSCS